MKYIVHLKTNQDSCDDTYCVDSLEEVGLALKQYVKDCCEPYMYVSSYDIEVIPCNELRKEKKDGK